MEGGALKNIRFAGHIRIPTIHNDYHSAKTNGGYSRNKTGGIYPKWLPIFLSLFFSYKDITSMDKVKTKFVNYKPGTADDMFLD